MPDTCGLTSTSKSPSRNWKPRSRNCARWRRRAATSTKKFRASRTRHIEALAELYGALTPWQKTLVARHPQRPHFVDFASALIADFTPLAGDRAFGEDEALLGGFGRFRGEADLRHRPGEGRDHRVPYPPQFRHGAARGLPQGDSADGAGRSLRPSRPVLRRFRPAPIPGSSAEERGQAEAIARSTDAWLVAGRAQCRGDHRRRLLGRRHRASRRPTGS